MKNSPEKLSFINLDRWLSIELAIKAWASQLFKPRQMLVVEIAVEF